MEWHQRYFHRKAEEHCERKPQRDRSEMGLDRSGQFAARCHLGKQLKVHAAGCKKEGQESQQQSDGADHGVDEELRSRRASTFAAPQLD